MGKGCQFAQKRSGVQTLTQLVGFTLDVLDAKPGRGAEPRPTLKLTGIDRITANGLGAMKKRRGGRSRAGDGLESITSQIKMRRRGERARGLGEGWRKINGMIY